MGSFGGEDTAAPWALVTNLNGNARWLRDRSSPADDSVRVLAAPISRQSATPSSRWLGDPTARAPHLLARSAADLLREERGNVVNIVDLSAFQSWADYPAHSVAKAALAHLTRIQARALALAPEIRVNGIAPGAVLPPDDWPTERWDSLAQVAPLQRVGSPEDVAQAVLFFAGAEFVTGQILAVDGGRLLGPAGPPVTARPIPLVLPATIATLPVKSGASTPFRFWCIWMNTGRRPEAL